MAIKLLGDDHLRGRERRRREVFEMDLEWERLHPADEVRRAHAARTDDLVWIERAARPAAAASAGTARGAGGCRVSIRRHVLRRIRIAGGITGVVLETVDQLIQLLAGRLRR